MLISRRDFLVSAAAASVSVCSPAQQQAAPFTLEFPQTELDPTLPTFAAANTSGYTYCQVLVLGMDGQVTAKSQNWATEPGVSVGGQMERLKDGRRDKYRMLMKMQPTSSRKPSVAAVVTQQKSADLTRLKQMSQLVRFKDDPGKPPGGRFEVDIYTESSVYVQIWNGESAQGATIFEKAIGHVEPGLNKIAWNLRTSAGNDARPGHYFASLVCTPYNRALLPIYVGSYFAVISDI
jgi:hypothetical protein